MAAWVWGGPSDLRCQAERMHFLIPGLIDKNYSHEMQIVYG